MLQRLLFLSPITSHKALRQFFVSASLSFSSRPVVWSLTSADFGRRPVSDNAAAAPIGRHDVRRTAPMAGGPGWTARLAHARGRRGRSAQNQRTQPAHTAHTALQPLTGCAAHRLICPAPGLFDQPLPAGCLLAGARNASMQACDRPFSEQLARRVRKKILRRAPASRCV